MLRRIFLPILGLVSIISLYSQLINVNPDPEGEPWLAGGLPEITPEIQARLDEIPEMTLTAHSENFPLRNVVDNSTEIYFRPIFLQHGASCAAAAGIGYTFTYEINRLRNLSSQLVENQYPTHYAWNYLNLGNGSGTWFTYCWDVVKDSGNPNIPTWDDPLGGVGSDEQMWMTGYDKYYHAMKNRIIADWHIDVSTPEGLETLKHYLNDHNDASDVGGIVVFGCFMEGAEYYELPPESSEAGKKIIGSFGDSGGGYHAMTFVGYNENVMFDFNGDGIISNHDSEGNLLPMGEWEIGALKIANSALSWPGGTYGNGFCYMSYRVLANGIWQGGIANQKVYGITVEDVENPLMTMRIKLTHPSRNKINIIAGTSEDVNSEYPTDVQEYASYSIQNGGDLPMQGISDEPIEIELDISSILNENTKKFFIQLEENDPDNLYNGEIISYSIVDYRDIRPREIIYPEVHIPITNNTTTTLSMVYDVLPEEIEEDIFIEHDVYLLKETHILPNVTVTVVKS